MSTAYSTLLGLALPVTSELAGTWGDVVNNYITNYLDASVAGTQTLSTDADVTLTKTTGTSLGSTSSQYAIINCTGARTALRTITAPAASKIYIVINATTGGYSVKLVGAGPTTGVTIANGKSAILAWNGSDFVTAASNDASVITGILAVANGGTGLSSGTSGGVLYYSASGTLASSAALAANAIVLGGGAGSAPATTTTGTGVVTALGVNTGSAGAFVVNGGALGTPSSGTVTNLTGTASININGTVGATTPSTGAFTTLSASSTVTFSATTQNLDLGSSQTSGTWTAGGAAQTGTLTLDQSTKAHTLNLGTGATENATTKTINLGTAGISGSTTTINIGSAVSGATNTITINGNPTFSGGTANGVLYLNGSKVATSGSALTFDGSSLGVGTTSPSQRIDSQIATTTEGSGLAATNSQPGGYGSGLSFYSYRTDGTTKVMAGQVSMLGAASWADSANSTSSMLFKTISAGTLSEQMRLTSTGLGIGTSSPAAKADVAGTVRSTSQTVPASGTGAELFYDATNAGLRGYNRTGSAYVNLALNDNMYVGGGSSGNLGLGVTPSAWQSGWKVLEIGNAGNAIVNDAATSLRLLSNARFAGSTWLYSSTNVAARYDINGGTHAWYTAPSGTAGNAITFTQAMTLDASGNLGVGTTSLTNTAGYATLSLNGSTGGQIAFQTAGTSKQFIYSTSTDITYRNDNGATIFFSTTERARIDSSGNLLVGRTSKFTDIGAFGSNIQSSTGFSATDGTNIAEYNKDRIYFDASNFYVINASAAGVVLANGSTAWAAQSDERTKEIIEPISDALKKTSGLRAVIGKYKQDKEGTRRAFLIAQDVQKVLPEAVSENDDEDKTLILRYTEIIPLLVASIQELKAEVDSLKAQLESK